MKCDITTLDNKSAGRIDLAEEVFGLEPRADLLQRTVTWQLAKRRAGTHKTKRISETAGSTQKIYRQKGTGRARHATRKVTLFRGGAKSFGPSVRSHEIKLPKKVRRLALKTALSSKHAEGNLRIIETAELKSPKTKDLAVALDKLGLGRVLFIDGKEIDANFALAARKLKGVRILRHEGANVYDILRCDTLVLTRTAVEQLEGRLK